MKSKTAVLCKELESIGIKSIFPTGTIKPNTESFASDLPQFAWWNSNQAKTEYEGLQESLSNIKELYRNDPFDGVFGFSQGAVFAPIVASSCPVKFVCCVSGFIPRPLNARKLITYQGPSLHVFGEMDGLVLAEHSRELAQLLSGTDSLHESTTAGSYQVIGNSTIINHKKGHLIPLDKPNRHLITGWIKQVVNPEKL